MYYTPARPLIITHMAFRLKWEPYNNRSQATGRTRNEELVTKKADEQSKEYAPTEHVSSHTTFSSLQQSHMNDQSIYGGIRNEDRQEDIMESLPMPHSITTFLLLCLLLYIYTSLLPLLTLLT
jgi:hypothetical protein